MPSTTTKIPRTGTQSTIVLDPEEFEAVALESGERSAGAERSEPDERAQRAGGRVQRGAGGRLRAAAAGGRRRGATYRTMFALCYGLGLRAGEACGLLLRDVDTTRDLLLVRGGKFGKSRLVPHGPRVAALLGEQLARRHRSGVLSGEEPLFTFDGSRSVHPGTATHTFHQLVTTLDLPVPNGVSRPTLHSLRHSFAVGACCAGIAKGLTRRPGCTSSRRSWVTSTRPRPPSI